MEEITSGDFQWLDGIGNYDEAKVYERKLKNEIIEIDKYYYKNPDSSDVNLAKLDALRYIIASRVVVEDRHSADDDYIVDRQNATIKAITGNWEPISSIMKEDAEKIGKAYSSKDPAAGKGIEKLSSLILENI